MVDFLFGEVAPDDDSWEKAMVRGPMAAEMLDGFTARAGALAAGAEVGTRWDAASLKALVEAIGEANGLKLGKAQAPVRVAVTGRTVGPPLFEALELLGPDVTLTRVRTARARLG